MNETPAPPSGSSTPQPPPAHPAAPETIPGFKNMSFAQQRFAQDQAAAAARTSKQKR
jgi:hypothetical protein